MALPGGGPFISSERRQQRHTLELPPLVDDNGKIGRDAKTDVRRGAGRPLGSARTASKRIASTCAFAFRNAANAVARVTV
ncbi:MAG: hypothetical protein WBE82_01105 [Xanthobacteraceae bacterium]